MTSAYPTPVDALIPQAQQLAAELGVTPSRNKLMSQFKIGAKKASQILVALTATAPAKAEPGRHLHPVPDPATPTDLADAPTPEQDQAGPVDRAPDPAEPGHPGPVTDPGASQDPPDTAPTEQAPSRPADPVPGPVTTPANPPAPTPVHGGETGPDRRGWALRVPRSWPLILLALPAFVAIWSGWVGLGELCGYGEFYPLPGIADRFAINTAITLPIGVETYAAYALRVWLAGSQTGRTRWFGKYSALGSLALGALGQIAYHLMSAAHVHSAPWWITTAVACLPVLVLGFAAALDHLQRHPHPEEVSR